MEYCKYHPLQAATYHCPNCDIDHCDQCIGRYDKFHQVCCHFCGQAMEMLGTGSTAVPFWRRLEASFRYPLNKEALPVILLISLGTTLITALAAFALPLIIVYLALNGAMLKYAMRCLEHTAAGDMNAPSPGDAYSGGLDLLGKLIIIVALLAAITFVLAAYVSPTLGGFFGMLVMLSLPAMLIHFAHSEEILDTLNPVNWLRLIGAIGLPYGLLIAFIMIMMGSVGVISELIGSRWSILGTALEAIVSNYYTVVLFHMMGYMLFQYQDKLGFSARASDTENERSALELLNAKVDVNLKEGDYNTVVQCFNEGLKTFPSDKPLAKHFFEFSTATRNKPLITQSAEHYLNLLCKNHEYDSLNAAFTAASRIHAGLLPKAPAVRLQLAKMSQAKGDAKTAVRLLNGLHKQAPQFSELAEVFSVLAQALTDLGLKPQADKCRTQATKLRKSTTEKVPKESVNERFSARDLTTKVPQAAADKPQNVPEKIAEPATQEPEDLPPIEFKL